MKLTLKDLPLKNQKVLMRVDFNVPIENGHITDVSRIQAAVKSIEYVLDHGGSLILMSHLGRPEGKVDPALSLAPCAKKLSEIIKRPVLLIQDYVGAKKIKPGQVMLLENLRFYPEEEKADPVFAKNLASLGDCYVNDAFGTMHRAHASTATIAQSFPQKAAMGFLVEKEIQELSSLLDHPKRPFYAIIGGAKIKDKLGVIEKLLQLVDGLFVGSSIFKTSLRHDKMHLPIDVVIAKDEDVRIISTKEKIPDGWMAVDIGPQTIQEWKKDLQQAATIFWNGPLGIFEKPQFAKGTEEIAKILSQSRARTIVGGGDSLAAIQKVGLSSKFAHLSTGGGASLEFLELGHLPGIDTLTEAN